MIKESTVKEGYFQKPTIISTTMTIKEAIGTKETINEVVKHNYSIIKNDNNATYGDKIANDAKRVTKMTDRPRW